MTYTQIAFSFFPPILNFVKAALHNISKAFGINEGILYRFDPNSQSRSCVVHAGINLAFSVNWPSIASQSNALGQDTSNSDSIAVGDDYDLA
ncbi:MAG: hypothetical protein WBZ36_18705 [Candidatus Nitrosopolaris sp.]